MERISHSIALIPGSIPEEKRAISFQHTWRIPNYNDIYSHGKQGKYILSDPVHAEDKAVLSLILFPKGRLTASEDQNCELYIMINEIQNSMYCYVSYFYGLLDTTGQLKEKVIVDKARIDCDDICLTPGNKWLPANDLLLNLQQDKSLILYLKGVLNCDFDGFPVEKSESNPVLPPVSKDELLLTPAPSRIRASRNLKVLRRTSSSADLDLYLQELRQYQKWSKLIVGEDSLLMTAADKYNIRQIMETDGQLLITQNNVINILLASDIYCDIGVKEKCLQFIEQQGTEFFATYAWRELRSYVPILQDEVMRRQKKQLVRKSRLVNIEDLHFVEERDWTINWRELGIVVGILIMIGLFTFYFRDTTAFEGEKAEGKKHKFDVYADY